MATQEDRTLAAGVSLPLWMKNKIPDKFDLDQGTFSPTEVEGSFMYYYRKPSTGRIHDNNTESMVAADTPVLVSQTPSLQDFSKHPKPCQKYLMNSGETSLLQKMTIQSTNKHKSSGTDDGFKGEAAKCGSSIVRVAHQMVAEKVLRDFTGKHEESDSTSQPHSEIYVPHRRGSKSLPASPMASPPGSPKPKRHVNKFFTGPFTDVDKSRGGWLLSSLLGKRDLSMSVGQINEETKEEMERSTSFSSVDAVPPSNSSSKVYKAKPSELREMNFWSPTSM